MNYDLCSGTCLKKSGIYSVAMFHVGASVISLAPTFLQKSERAHSAAPPLQIEPAALGFDLVLGTDLKVVASILLRCSNPGSLVTQDFRDFSYP